MLSSFLFFARRTSLARPVAGLVVGLSTALVSPALVPAQAAAEPVAEEPVAAAYGPAVYAPETSYSVGSVVRAADGNLYRAFKDVKAADPATSDGSTWRLERVDESLTLDVPGRFPTIADAWTFLADAKITTAASVTIQLAPERYALKAPLRLDRADSGRIVLDGGRQPDRCTLVFSGSNGIEVHEGGGLTIQGLTVKVVNAADRECIGIVVGHGAKARLERVNVEGFWAGVVAEDGGRIEAEQCNVETTSRRSHAGGFKALRNATMRLVRCKATNSKRENNHSFGFLAATGGDLSCESCEASGWHHGFSGCSCGSVWLTNCSSEGNMSGLMAFLGGTATVSDCQFVRNESWAVNSAEGTVHLSGCTLRDSVWGCLAVLNGHVAFRGSPCQISGCTKAAFQSKGGGTFVGLKPTLTDNRDEFVLFPATTPADQVFFWE